MPEVPGHARGLLLPETLEKMEARAGIEPAIGLLQSPALPLGDLAVAETAREGRRVK
jgi:hypothetical protein